MKAYAVIWRREKKIFDEYGFTKNHIHEGHYEPRDDVDPAKPVQPLMVFNTLRQAEVYRDGNTDFETITINIKTPNLQPRKRKAAK